MKGYHVLGTFFKLNWLFSYGYIGQVFKWKYLMLTCQNVFSIIICMFFPQKKTKRTQVILFYVFTFHCIFYLLSKLHKSFKCSMRNFIEKIFGTISLHLNFHVAIIMTYPNHPISTQNTLNQRKKKMKILTKSNPDKDCQDFQVSEGVSPI